MIDYSLILLTNYSNKNWILSGPNYENIDWHDESPKPTKEELKAKIMDFWIKHLK